MRLEDFAGDDWPALPCPVHQHPRYGETVRRMGGTVGRYRILAGENEIGRVQVLVRRWGPFRLAWVGRGPVWLAGVPEAERRAALAGLAGALPGVALVQPDREDEAAWFGAPALMTAPSVAELDLAAPGADRMARQHGKWRNRLRKAQAAGLILGHRPLDPAADAGLLAREAEQRRARRYAALPPAFLHHWAGHDRAATRLFTAQAGGEVVAYMAFLMHPPVATYHVGWSGAEGRRLSAHHLLLWQASEWLAARGFARLDLGTVDTETSPGLARFKIGSGARIRAIGPTLLPLPRILHHPLVVLRAFPLAIRRNRG
ncbi:GNAT family N-acetyltransferase [Roseovarius sp.]|uniref:GNAT family N-acetyltransferase n=1 Tax=Roseovarius sp. TaxID=1486281 RepID=UPI002604B8BD|nr:GNAT family N-acetyltransferase [Roseovarius sp.]MDM8167809.1 GNAT family N-acetyltransferase [Roseovarius sp.]